MASVGGWIDPQYLPQAVRQALRDHLAVGDIKGQAAEGFVDSCARHAQRVMAGFRKETHAERRDEFTKLASAAEQLHNALSEATWPVLMDIEMHVHEAAGLGDDQAQEHAERLASFDDALDGLTLDCAALRAMALAAAAAESQALGGAPALEAGQGLMHGLLAAFEVQFGKLPPAGQESWFVDLCNELGNHLGLTCGARVYLEARKARAVKYAAD